jgi:O-antigen/teichoic acid export membrane protein
MTMRSGAGFAFAVAGIQLGEQTLLNAVVIVADAVSSAAVAGAIFNALLITRAPLQLFQSVQTSLLPHLTGLEATEGQDSFRKAIRVTVLAIAGFAVMVAAGLLIIGPKVMQIVFGHDTTYGRVGLAIVALGMGFHLAAGTLNQAALARGRANAAAGLWLFCAALFVAWVASPIVSNVLLRAEVGYAASSALLCLLLWLLYRRDAVAP